MDAQCISYTKQWKSTFSYLWSDKVHPIVPLHQTYHRQGNHQVEKWFSVYGVPKEVKSDKDVKVRSDIGWYKTVLTFLNVQVSTGIPYAHTSNPLCKRLI